MRTRVYLKAAAEDNKKVLFRYPLPRIYINFVPTRSKMVGSQNGYNNRTNSTHTLIMISNQNVLPHERDWPYCQISSEYILFYL